MFPYYQGKSVDFALGYDDILAMYQLYSKPAFNVNNLNIIRSCHLTNPKSFRFRIQSSQKRILNPTFYLDFFKSKSSSGQM
jgi:hypothetical protein